MKNSESKEQNSKIPEAVKLAIDDSAFVKIDDPQENITLSPEVKSQMPDAFAQVHIDYNKSLNEKGKRDFFLSNLAKTLSVEKIELNEAIEDREKLSALFSKLQDKDLIILNWDKDGFPAIKPNDLSTTSIQEYCNNIDFRGVMVVDDGKGNQTRVSNYKKGNQIDPGDRPFATHSVSKLIGGVTMCKMIANGMIPEGALDSKLELAPEVIRELPEEISKHLEDYNVTLRDVMTHRSGLGGYLDPELKEGQPGYETGKSGYGINGYSGYVRQKLEREEEVEVPNSPQDYLKYAETITYQYNKPKYSDLGITYEYDKPKYSDLGIMLASLSAEHHYNKEKDPNKHKSFEEIVQEQLIIPADVKRFSAQKPDDAVCHLDDPIAPYITGTAACGYWTNLDGLVKIGQQIGKMWQEDKKFRETVQNCGQEFYDEKKQIIKHGGAIDSSTTLLSVDLASGSVVVTEERRLGSYFTFPGLGVLATARNLAKEQSNQKQPQVQAGNLNATQEQELGNAPDALDLATPQKPSPSPKKSYVEKMTGKSRDGFNEL